MVEFRLLGYFLTACEFENLGAAAAAMRIAPSTLSASLKAIERDFDVTLLQKHGSGVIPQPAAHWLFRAGLPLLLLEAFARRRLQAAPDAQATLLRLEIGSRFSFGRVGKAINRAIAETAIDEPLVLVQPDWINEVSAGLREDWPTALDIARVEQVSLEPVSRAADEASGEMTILSDPWLMVRRQVSGDRDQPPTDQDFAGQIFAAPALSLPLLAQAQDYVRRHRLGEFRLIDGHPAALPQMIEDHLGVTFLMPSTVMAARLGMTNIVTRMLTPPLESTLVGRARPGDEVGSRFLHRVKRALAAPEGATIFAPELTSRRIRYFNLAFEHRRVSAAARAAGIAQPALSEQVRKLESTLGTMLFERTAQGLRPTEQGERLARAAGLLERRQRELLLAGMAIAAGESGHLTLGILPSISQHGPLADPICDTLACLRARYPMVRLSVREAPDPLLQSWVSQGQIGLAIVETALPHLPRAALRTAELLAVIADPRHDPLAPGPVRIADLTKTPIILPTRSFGLRQAIDDAARGCRVELRPDHEIDSLAMLMGLVRRGAWCTILPLSSVQPDIDRGALVVHPLIDPSVERRLFVVYSGDRTLSQVERDFIAMLRERVASGPLPG